MIKLTRSVNPLLQVQDLAGISRTLAGVALTLAAQFAAADEPQRSYFIEVAPGAEYDSVVALDELDLSQDEADYALLLDLSAGLTQGLGEDVELDLEYKYSVRDYLEYSQADQRSHILSADLKRDVGAADIGVAAFYIDSTLDTGLFLEMARFSPYVSGFFREGWFGRAAYVYYDKSNEVNAGRDAATSVGEIDLYHFPTGRSWYVNVGYKYRDENASAARFDYIANIFKARWVRRLQFWERSSRVELSYRYIDRDYSALTPSIAEQRRDRRSRLRAELEMDLSPQIAVELYYAFSAWESNLDSVDFDQNVAGLRFRYRWDSR